MQPVRKRLAVRRATAGLAVGNSREHNNADDRFLTGPEGAPQIDQCASPKAPTVGALANLGRSAS